MKLALPYKHGHKLMNEVEEFNIRFNQEKNDFKKLMTFCSTYPNHKINVEIETLTDYKEIEPLFKTFNNLRVRLTHWVPFVNILRSNDVPFFFTVPAGSYTMLNQMLELGVCAVFLADDLCFDIDNARYVVSRYNEDVQTRLVLNKIPSLGFYGYSAKDPIFRPEDVDRLSTWIDVFEFDCGDTWDWHVCEVLVKTYFEKKRWIGLLNELNSDILFDYPNGDILTDMLQSRYTCSRRCQNGFTCNVCDDVLKLAQMAYENGLILRKGD